MNLSLSKFLSTTLRNVILFNFCILHHSYKIYNIVHTSTNSMNEISGAVVFFLNRNSSESTFLLCGAHHVMVCTGTTPR